MFQRKTFVSVVLASALALPAFAQDAAPAAPAADDGAQRTGIEEIQITARKVTENLQQSPIAVSALGSDMLDSLGVEDTEDVSALAPNLYMTQTPSSSANLALAIRGVGGAEPLLTREQGVAIYMDGAYIARVTGAIMDLVDIERVEVLRGPQGTLYGRNATGGAVNFISRKPTEDFNAYASFGTGSFSRVNGVFRVNTGELLPEVVPGLAASFAYVHNQVDGYIDNRLVPDGQDPGAKNTDALRIALGWDITEAVRLDYAYDFAALTGASPAFQLLAVGPTATLNLNNGCGFVFPACVPPVNLKTSRKRLDKISLDSVGPSDHEIRGHNLTVEVDLGFATAKSITTYRKWDNTEVGGDLDGNVLPSPLLVLTLPAFAPAVVSGRDLFSADNERHQDQWTQELQLIGDIGEQFRYVTGFYYFTEEYSEANVQRLLNPLPAAFGGLFLDVTAPFAYTGDAQSWALYANGTFTFPFLDDRLSLTAGIRYSDDEKSFDKTSAVATSNSGSWDHIDWETSLSFNVTDNITTYFRAASAYKAGGFNLRQQDAPIEPFEEEELTSVEVGIKTEWWDNRIRANLTGFWSTYDNLQTDVFKASASGANSETINAGEAEIPGLEFEFLAVPIDGLTLNANVGWIKPKYNEYLVLNNNGTPANPADDFEVDVADEAKFGYKPEVTTSLGAEYATPPLGSLGWVLTPRVDARYTGSRIWSPLETAAPLPDPTPYRDLLEDDGYWLLDVRMTVSEIAINDQMRARVTAYGKNLTDESYMLSGIDFGGLDFAGAIYGEGRTWGLDISVDF